MEMTWKATLDKHASETDLVLGKMGTTFTITVGKDAMSIKPTGCCVGSPYVLPLVQIKEVKMVTAEWALPSFVVVGEKEGELEGELITFFHKFYLDGGETAIVEACNKVDAQTRLLSGQVLVAGYIDSSVPNHIMWLSPADTRKVFETESTMITSAVGDKKTLALPEMEGTVTFTRLTYGTEMLFSKEGMEVPCSVFCERVHTIQFQLPVVEEDVMTGEGEVVKAFRLKYSKDGSSTGTWTVTMDPKVVLSAPYLAGLKQGASARPRVTSFNMPKCPRFSVSVRKSKAKPPAAKPPPATTEEPVDGEAPVEPPKEKESSPRGGLLATIKRKASLTKGQPIEKPAEAPAEAPAAEPAK